VISTREYRPWGHASPSPHAAVVPVRWRSELPALADLPGSVLPFACGRSYGDSCLNEGGTLLDVAALDRFIAFDEQEGLLRCEAGVTLAEVLAVIVPRGWFLPVVPGTQQVSVGGAIANDIHGKNHHRAGTFGAHVTRFELLRSTGECLVCSASDHAELFRATIGGLGLTGLVLWAEIRLKRVPGAAIALERIRFRGLDDFVALSTADRDFEYTVAWIDCLRRRGPPGRGVYMRGDHAADPPTARPRPNGGGFRLPFVPPRPMLGRLPMSAFNTAYYWRQIRERVRTSVGYEPFFFPLDAIANWNRLYGPPGLVQYQCVAPDPVIRVILEDVRRSGQGCYLAVLKKFGAMASPGLLSFPRPGVTLAMDFAFRGDSTLRLLDRLDRLVAEAGGAVYPAKDVRMSGASFRTFYPRWEEFAEQVDPKFSSSFWRRVTAR
jgi:FAD/FMN-containing dehydrogenase